MKAKLIFFIVAAIIFSSCSVTIPRLSHSGGNYNSVSDDVILYNSTQAAISKLADALNSSQKVLLVQVVNNDVNDQVADQVFEELYKRGYTVGLVKNDELKEMNTDLFTHYLMFYPVVFGTETAETNPSSTAKMVYFIPLIGQIVGPMVMKANTYIDRHGRVTLHARLVNAETGKIEWINRFAGSDRLRLEGGRIKDILLGGI